MERKYSAVLLSLLMLLGVIVFSNGVFAEEYSFERKNQELPKITKTIGSFSSVPYWYLNSAGQWQESSSDFEKIQLKEISIKGKKFYLLSIIEEDMRWKYPNLKIDSYYVDEYYNYILKKEEFNKFEKINELTEPILVKLNAKYFVETDHSDESVPVRIKEFLNGEEYSSVEKNNQVYLNCLPFYEHGVIRFHILGDRGGYGLQKDVSNSSDLKKEALKNSYNEMSIEEFKKVFPISYNEDVTVPKDEYSFPRKNQKLPKITKHIGEFGNARHWYLSSAGQWNDYISDLKKVMLKELSSKNNSYYLLSM